MKLVDDESRKKPRLLPNGRPRLGCFERDARLGSTVPMNKLNLELITFIDRLDSAIECVSGNEATHAQKKKARRGSVDSATRNALVKFILKSKERQETKRRKRRREREKSWISDGFPLLQHLFRNF